jgi:hypothetical protein
MFAVTLAIYWPVHAHDFIGLDDDEYVTENIHVRNGFTRANVRWAFTSVRYVEKEKPRKKAQPREQEPRKRPEASRGWCFYAGSRFTRLKR